MNKRSEWKVRALLALLLSAGGASIAVAQPAAGQSEDEDEVKLEKFEVTGSRIKRLDVETPVPVVALTRAELDSTGFSTVGDAMRSLPFNTGQSLTPIDSGTSFTPGVSTFNLRGLGNNNVLVLINGRRAAPFGASGFNGFQTLFDFNSLPTGAIESIEVLKDGGSAIYGSDAVSGVVNIKLRRDYQGASATVAVGNTFETDSLEKSFFLLWGTSSNKTSIVTTFDWYERNAIFARDYGFSSNTDLRNIGGIDRSSTAGYPGLVYVPSLGAYRTFLAPTSTPTAADAVPFGTAREGDTRAGYYNFLKDSDLFPELKYYGFYTRVEHQITDPVKVFAELSFRRAETLSQAAPTPMFNFNEQGDAPDGSIVVPATNPFNPWGEDLYDDVRFRLVPTGTRKNDVTSDTPRVIVGLEGEVGPSWSWESAVTYTKSSFTNTNPGAAQDRLLQDAFNGVTFNAGTPEEVTLYMNPFGPSDQRIYDYVTITNPVTSTYDVRAWDFRASGELLDLPAGALGLAVGGEYREENLEDVRTALNETAQIVGGSEGSSVYGGREVYAAFAELSIPVLRQVEIQAAARFEDYSDFGNTTKPKFAIKYRPFRSLILRASVGESFLAPNLPFLYSTQSTSFTSQSILDPRRPDDAAQQIKQLSGGNPGLQPEETKTYYAGVVYEPHFLKGWSFGVDYFIFDSENLITRFDAATILAGEAEGDPLFTSLVVRNAPQAGETVGTIQFVRTEWLNADERKYKGADFNVRYEFNTNTLGRFKFQASATYLDELTFGTPNNFAGSRLFPRWRGNFTAAWQRKDWSASLFINYIDSRNGTNQRSGTAQVTNRRYEEQWLVNPQVAYSGLFDTTITVGVRNVLNEEPPLDYGEATRYTPGVNNPESAFWYVRLGREF